LEDTIEPPSQELQYVGKTYILANARDLFNHNPLSIELDNDLCAFSGGRLNWDTIFTRYFGSAFEQLLKEQKHAMSVIVSSAARILREIVYAENTVPHSLLSIFED
jgi:hypothetical protein